MTSNNNAGFIGGKQIFPTFPGTNGTVTTVPLNLSVGGTATVKASATTSNIIPSYIPITHANGEYLFKISGTLLFTFLYKILVIAFPFSLSYIFVMKSLFNEIKLVTIIFEISRLVF